MMSYVFSYIPETIVGKWEIYCPRLYVTNHLGGQSTCWPIAFPWHTVVIIVFFSSCCIKKTFTPGSWLKIKMPYYQRGKWNSSVEIGGCDIVVTPQWFCQLRKIAVCACARSDGNVFPATAGQRSRHTSRACDYYLRRNPWASCQIAVTHVPWYMPG